jgi:hypothetical protein
VRYADSWIESERLEVEKRTIAQFHQQSCVEARSVSRLEFLDHDPEVTLAFGASNGLLLSALSK